MRERVCKNCGGREYKVVGQNMVKCKFCGTLYVDEHASKEEDVLIVGAYEHLRDADFEGAVDEFDKILALFPLSFEAFYGRTLAKNKIVPYKSRGTRDIPRFFDAICSISDDADFKKAVELAPSEVAKSYTDMAKRIDKIKKAYDEKTKEKTCDIFVCGQADEKILAEISQALNGKNLHFASQKDEEEETFSALSSSKAFLLLASEEQNFVEYKNMYDRYLFWIKQRTKARGSLVLVKDSNKNIKLPKELSSCKSVVDVSSTSFLQDLQILLEEQMKKTVAQVAKIDTVKVEKVQPKKKEYVDLEGVTPSELGAYRVENRKLNEDTKLRWIYLSLKNEDYETAKGLIAQEMPKDPYNAELLFAEFLCEKKIATREKFFSSISNFTDRERLDKILICATKGFAESFVDSWEELLISIDSEDYYNQYLIYLAGFNSPNRERFIEKAESKAIETMNTSLIDKVLKCFDKNDVERFVHFYFLLAQKSGDDKYFEKVLQLDAGHMQSNLALLMRNFKTKEGVLTYQNKQELEDALKYLDESSRADFVSAVVWMILPVAFNDLEKAEKQLDFYLAYVGDEKKLKGILTDIYKKFQEMGFFKQAEKYLSVLISKDKENAVNYWDLIQIKAHCKTVSELVSSSVKIIQMPEWSTLLELSNNQKEEEYAEIVSKSNLYKGKRTPFEADMPDKVTLISKLQEFIDRNERQLLDAEKSEGFSAVKGVQYFKLQLQPFKKYIEDIKKVDSFQKFSLIYVKVKDRLNLLGLSFDSTISMLDLVDRDESLSEYKTTTEIEQKHEKIVKNIKKDVFLKRFCMIFLEFFPILFTTLLLIVSIFLPKEVYLYFSQTFLIGMTIFSAAIALGNMTYYFIKKKKLFLKLKLALIGIMCLGFLNVILLCVSFFVMPNQLSVTNEREFKTLVANANFSELVLEKDLDFNGRTFKSVNFHGILDGKGHTISNVKVAEDGLFKTNNGIIKNLSIVFSDCEIRNPRTFGAVVNENSGLLQNITVSGKLQFVCNIDTLLGGFVGINEGGKILNCKNNLQITISVEEVSVVFGGIAGKVEAGNGGTEIKQNANYLNLELSTPINSEDEQQRISAKSLTIGGMIGELGFGMEQNYVQENANHIQMTFTAAANDFAIGGMIGVARSSLKNNYSQGEIDAISLVGEGKIGGLVGSYQNTNLHEYINDCYSSVVISGDHVKGSIAGFLGGNVTNSFGIYEAYGEKSVWATTNGYVKLTDGRFFPTAHNNFSSEIWSFVNGQYPTFLWEEHI